MSLRELRADDGGLVVRGAVGGPQFQPSDPQGGGGFSSKKLVSMGSTSRGRSA